MILSVFLLLLFRGPIVIRNVLELGSEQSVLAHLARLDWISHYISWSDDNRSVLVAIVFLLAHTLGNVLVGSLRHFLAEGLGGLECLLVACLQVTLGIGGAAHLHECRLLEGIAVAVVGWLGEVDGLVLSLHALLSVQVPGANHHTAVLVKLSLLWLVLVVVADGVRHGLREEAKSRSKQ